VSAGENGISETGLYARDGLRGGSGVCLRNPFVTRAGQEVRENTTLRTTPARSVEPASGFNELAGWVLVAI